MRWGGIFDYENKKELLEETVRELEDPEVWNDPEKARKLGENRTNYENVVLKHYFSTTGDSISLK